MITVLTGDDSFGLKSELDRLTSSFIKEQGELAIERLDAEEASIEQILDALQGVSFFAPHKMVVVRGVAKHKDLLDGFEATIGTIPETTDVILVDAKLDKRAKYYKLLQKLTDFKEFSSTQDKDLTGWVVSQVSAQQGTINRSDAAYLIQQIGTNKTQLANELAKLIAFEPHVSRANIDLLCEPTPQSTVFQLLDAAFGGNIKRAHTLYEDQRKQRVEPLAILAMITWQLHILATIKTAGSKSIDEIAKLSKLNPFVVRKSKAIADRLSLAQVKMLVGQALKLDVRLKSESIDADEALEYFLLGLQPS